MQRWAVVGAIGLLTSTARADDQSAAAESTYERAKALAEAGNYAEACPLYETSFKVDPALGTLLNLADCNARGAARLERPLADHHLFYATRAELRERAGDDARGDLERAIALVRNDAERELLERRLRRARL